MTGPEDTLRYSRRIVAFVDILGWRALVSDSTTGQASPAILARMLHHLQSRYAWLADAPRRNKVESRELKIKTVMREQDGWMKDFQFAQFSDSIILSARPSRLGVSIFLLELIDLTNRHLSARSLLRGGITIGDMYHAANVAFGPALTRAYDLESTKAFFPRIVIDPLVLDLILDHPYVFDCRRKRRKIHDFPLIMKDRDGQHFLNFLTARQHIAAITGAETGLGHPVLDDPRLTAFAPLRPHIEDCLNSFAGNPRVLAKYEWLAKYYNDCAQQCPELSIERINIV